MIGLRPMAPSTLFLRRVRLAKGVCDSDTDEPSGFPFDLPCLEDLDLELGAPVTFLVGENGTGKSTLLEAIALATRCVAVGHADLDRDPTLAPASRLASRLRLVRGTRPRTALFFRAEDAFGFVQRTSRAPLYLPGLASFGIWLVIACNRCTIAAGLSARWFSGIWRRFEPII